MGKAGKDKFGFILGTKRALAAQLYERGATQLEIVAATGITQYNMLKEAERRGHRVIREGDRYWLVSRSTTQTLQTTSPERNTVMPAEPSVNEDQQRARTTLIDRIRADITTEYYRQNYPNDGQRFLAWYLRTCYSRTAKQARDDITDGADDKEIDAIIVDEEKRQVIIVQSKFFAGPVDHQPLQEVLSAWIQIKNLAMLQANCNQKLQVKLEAVAEALSEEYDVIFELVATGTLTESAIRDLAAFQSSLASIDDVVANLTLVDSSVIETRWTEAIGRELFKLIHELKLEEGKYLLADTANCKVLLAMIPLTECLRFPGIIDGKLFRPNVRQALGQTNRVNKGMRQTLSGETPEYFFFYHNGITALCENLSFDPTTRKLRLDGLGVVNGCQSLTTILSCSERVRAHPEARVLVRFYEIPERKLATECSKAERPS